MGPTLRKSFKIKKRGQKGRILRECKCLVHEQIIKPEEDLTLLDISKSKKCSTKVIGKMRQANVLSAKANIVCNQCLQHYTGSLNCVNFFLKLFNYFKIPFLNGGQDKVQDKVRKRSDL